MTIEVKLPQFGMGMSEAVITRWLKAEGDAVAADEPLVEAEAAKTNLEVVAPQAGILRRILAPEGMMVPVYDVIALLDVGDGATDPIASTETEDEAPLAVEVGDAKPPVPVRSGGGPPGASPRARRLAETSGIDLATLTGSGPEGRITDEDVRQAIAARDGAVASCAAAARTDRAATALSPMRATIARRMLHSLRETAQYTLTRSVDVTALLKLHEQIRAAGARVSINDLMIRAVAVALRRHPNLNATLDDGGIVRHSRVDIGFAVALDEGLMVPVIRAADSLSLAGIAGETRRLTDLVRSGHAPLAEISDATFTVSNLGGVGVEAFTPVLNPPEVAILGIGAIVDQAARGPDDSLVWRKAITFSLTLDHRAVDGMPGAQFLESIGEIVSDPDHFS